MCPKFLCLMLCFFVGVYPCSRIAKSGFARPPMIVFRVLSFSFRLLWKLRQFLPTAGIYFNFDFSTPCPKFGQCALFGSFFLFLHLRLVRSSCFFIFDLCVLRVVSSSIYPIFVWPHLRFVCSSLASFSVSPIFNTKSSPIFTTGLLQSSLQIFLLLPMIQPIFQRSQ